MNREGVWFKHGMSSTPTCTPARAAILTGQKSVFAESFLWSMATVHFCTRSDVSDFIMFSFFFKKIYFEILIAIAIIIITHKFFPRPWNHGMLGYGKIALKYPVEMPRILQEAGYYTASKGKDHFGWDPDRNHSYAHGYKQTQVYIP